MLLGILKKLLFEGSQVLSVCPDKSSIMVEMSMQQGWTATDQRATPKYSNWKLSHWNIIYHKSHIDWSGIEARTNWREVGV